MILFGWVLWHINHCRLFNAKPFFYLYIKNMIPKHILLILFLNNPEHICLHTVKWFLLILWNEEQRKRTVHVRRKYGKIE